ncbi:MAG: hypothetical protein AAF226_00390 [Verrucomicrobiota bacterium]
MFRSILIVCFLISALGFSSAEDKQLPSIERMPDLPPSYLLRDWKAVARDFDQLVFDPERQGEHLPLYWEESSREANEVDGFGLPSYVGDFRQNPKSNAHEAITTMSAVLSGTLIGKDKRYHAEKLRAKFHQKDGIGLYLNHFTTTGDSFWYDTLPSLLFLHLHSHYPDIPGYSEQLESTGRVWRQMLIDLGGSDTTLPDFDHTGFDFLKRKPVDQAWKEPDIAAGSACILYLCYLETKDEQLLQAAHWALDWLAAREQNPFYENLMPYGAYIASRSNAEQATAYPTDKLIEWTLNGNNPRKWGSALESWNSTPVHGLIGSVYPDYEYMFAMNSFQAVGIMAPIARYEEQYAKAIAKWILNVASNGRYFYANAWPKESQSSWAWAAKHDPTFCIPYEGLRKQGTTRDYPEDHQLISGEVFDDNAESPEKDFTLKTDAQGNAEWVGAMEVPPGESQKFMAVFPHRASWKAGKVSVSLSDNHSGPWESELTFLADDGPNLKSTPVHREGKVWVKVKASAFPKGASVRVHDVLIETRFSNPPHVGGDPTVHEWGATDLGLYGGSSAGFLGAMITPSNVEGILLIDPVATDMCPPKSFPTRLVFNPHDEEKTIEVPMLDGSTWVYDSIGNEIITTTKTSARITLGSKEAKMLVFLPHTDFTTVKGKLYCDGVIIDYHHR